MILSMLFSLSASASPSSDFLADLELFRARSLVIRSERQAFEASKSFSTSRLFQVSPKLSAGVGREGARVEAPTAAASSDSRDWYWRATADWNLFRGGGDYLSWRSAKSSQESQDFELRGQELKTEVDGANVIFRRLFLRDSQSAQAELLKLKQDTLRIGRDRYSQGKIPLQDVVKMEVDLSQQQNVVRQSEIDLAENEAAYRSFFVEELKTREWPFSSKQEPLPGDSSSFEQRRQRSRAEALDLSWRSSLTRNAPSLDFNLVYKKFPLETTPAKTWTGVLELSIPIWTRWETMSDNAQSYASSVRALDEADQAARDEKLRREFLSRKMSLSRANLEESSANLDRADHLYRDMLRSFQLGRLSTNDLFLEQDRKIRAILSFSQARLDFHTSLMEACALGGLSAGACLR